MEVVVISDVLHDDAAFYVTGGVLVIGGLLGSQLNKVKRWEAQREHKLKIVHIEELTNAEPEMLRIENCESTI